MIKSRDFFNISLFKIISHCKYKSDCIRKLKKETKQNIKNTAQVYRRDTTKQTGCYDNYSLTVNH
jgi:hypothetical protein